MTEWLSLEETLGVYRAQTHTQGYPEKVAQDCNQTAYEDLKKKTPKTLWATHVSSPSPKQ